MEKRDQILDAALHLFVERGFQNTPTSLIAKTAGVATGTLFHNFENKEELINETYLTTKRSFAEDLANGVNLEKSLEDKLKKIWINGVRWGLHYPEKYRFFQQFSNSPFITAFTREQAMKEFSFLINIVEGAIDDGIFLDMPKDFLGPWFTGQMLQAISHLLNFPDQATDANIQKIFNIFWKGITKD